APPRPAACSSPLRQRKLRSSTRRRSRSSKRSDSATVIPSKDLVAPSQNLVQSLAPERRALGHLGADLLDVLLPALLDLVLEELRQGAVAQPLLALLRMIHDEVRHERACETARLLFRILHHERIHGAQWSRHPLSRSGPREGSGRGGRCGGGGGGGRGGGGWRRRRRRLDRGPRETRHGLRLHGRRRRSRSRRGRNGGRRPS